MKTPPRVIKALVIGDAAGKVEARKQLDMAKLPMVIDEICLDEVKNYIEQDMSNNYGIIILATMDISEQWLDVLRTLRSKWNYKALPIIVISVDTSNELQAIVEGANGFVEKTDDYLRARYFGNLVTALSSSSPVH